MDDFEELVVCGRSVKAMLELWKVALSIEEHIYLNLVHVFYSNMEIFTNRLDRIIINIGEVPIEFDKEALN